MLGEAGFWSCPHLPRYTQGQGWVLLFLEELPSFPAERLKAVPLQLAYLAQSRACCLACCHFYLWETWDQSKED